jgi:methylated-DNA-[protein]-cysteine S-methyltransferase
MNETMHRIVVDSPGNSPVGALTLVASPRGLRHVEWFREDGDNAAAMMDAVDAPDPTGHLAQAADELDEYFAGARVEFTVALDPVGTPFQLEAWRALCTIPYGETVSYGEQARRLGDVGKARAVGAANGRNPIPIIIPCHRVVGANGSLTGFGGGLPTKAWLLDHERKVWIERAWA